MRSRELRVNYCRAPAAKQPDSFDNQSADNELLIFSEDVYNLAILVLVRQYKKSNQRSGACGCQHLMLFIRVVQVSPVEVVRTSPHAEIKTHADAFGQCVKLRTTIPLSQSDLDTPVHETLKRRFRHSQK